MKTIILILCIATCMLSCKKEKKVHLKGEFKNFYPGVILVSQSPLNSFSRQGIEIELDENNCFEITFQLNEPAYFLLGKNHLYLSPGDDLELFCDYKDPSLAKFKGKGEVYCKYLSSLPYPKYGLYENPNKLLNDSTSFSDIMNLLEEKTADQENLLNRLSGVSEKFKNYELARMRFENACTILTYPRIVSYKRKFDKAETEKFESKLMGFFEEKLDEWLSSGGNADYLCMDSYKIICGDCVDHLGKENVDPEILDWLTTQRFTSELLLKGATSNIVSKKEEALKEVKAQSYKDIIIKSFNKYENVLPVKSAPQFCISNKEGKEVKLSDFSGKTVVIDIWATWCEPCKKESPYFEKLAEKYQKEDIEFISISVDTNKEDWEKYLSEHPKTSRQYISSFESFEQYLLTGIPRFMIIDENGKIVTAYAPKPSNFEFEEIICSIISEKRKI